MARDESLSRADLGDYESGRAAGMDAAAWDCAEHGTPTEYESIVSRHGWLTGGLTDTDYDDGYFEGVGEMLGHLAHMVCTGHAARG